MNEISLIPGVRVSDTVDPELRIYSDEADFLEIYLCQGTEERLLTGIPLKKGVLEKQRLSLGGSSGNMTLRFRFLEGERTVHRLDYPFQVIPSGLPMTGLVDGCWLSLYHWSEEEGRYFNPDLKKLAEADFARQVQDMYEVGIRGIVLQNLFDSAAYVKDPVPQTCETYGGRAFYPSALYPGRMPITAEDPVEAILSAADRYGMQVLLGIGLFAWFDFSPESLRWHKQVAMEVYRHYAHHPSFYGWYVSEEIMGDLYTSYFPEQAQRWKELPEFFRAFGAFVKGLTPTKPVAFAPNNIHFEQHEEQWKQILPYIDILLPFAFARDPELWNVEQMKQICESCDTHMWVDMEMFDTDFENGLRPKTFENLCTEIRQYQVLEQCYGYQYTGILNHPQSPFDLGGAASKALYRRYKAYYETVNREGENGHE